ncbi:hypothetical protein ACWERI_36185 [Streptomyces collinus]|uniref:hypothetical protein n=1 Tax=Streptomyces collinus TaxID=42684 RepID=UPI0010E88035
MTKHRRHLNTRMLTAVAAALLGVAVLLLGARAVSRPSGAVDATGWVQWNSMGTGYNPS